MTHLPATQTTGIIHQVQLHKYRTWKTVCVSLLFLALGLHSAIFGPSLIDLMVQVNTTIDQITHILPVRAFGNMIGSTACGFVLAYLDYQIVLMFSMLTMCLSFITVPLCSSLMMLYCVMLVNGISGGFLVNAGNSMVIHCWGKETGPFMQLAHFSFGIGAFCSPFIVEPFLREISDSELGHAPVTTPNSTSSDVSQTPLTIDPSTLRIKWAFFIIGALSLLIWSTFVATYLKKRDNKPHESRGVKVKEPNNNTAESVVTLEIVRLDEKSMVASGEKNEKMVQPGGYEERTYRGYHKFVIVLLAALFIHLAYGLELSFGVMLASYARLSGLALSKSRASFVTSLYWGCFTFFRLCTLVLISYISARSMLLIDLALIMASNVVLLPFANHYEWALWVGSALMGIGVSSIYPTLWSFLEMILPVTSKMTSVVNSCACVGEFIVPVLIGLYIETNPDIFLYIVCLYSVLACVIFGLSIVWEFVIYRYQHKKRQQASGEVYRASE